MQSHLLKVLKKAYSKKAISRKDYEKAVEYIKGYKPSGRQKTTPALSGEKDNEITLGEIKIVKDESGTRVVFDTGNDEIPLSFDSNRINIPSAPFYDIIRVGNYFPLFSGDRAVPIVIGGHAANSGINASGAARSDLSGNAKPNDAPLADEGDSMDSLEEEENVDTIGEATDEKTAEKDEPPSNKEDVVIGGNNPENSIDNKAQDTNAAPESSKYTVENTQDKEQKQEEKPALNEQETPLRNIDNESPEKSFSESVEFSSPVKDAAQNPVKAVSDDVELIDIKKEIPAKEKKEEKKKKQKKGKKEKGPGLLTKILKGKKTESRDAKLERIAKENLEKIKGIPDNRRAIVKLAHVLKDFLEIKMEIPFSTTYGELIEIAAKKEKMEEEMKKEIIGFFKKMEECEYSRGFEGESFSDFYKSARRIVEEMSR